MGDGPGKSITLLLGLLILATACAGPGGAGDSALRTPATMPSPTVAAAPASGSAEDSALRTPATASADPGFSRTEDGYYVRGRADAPVIIEDYSDFL